MDTDRLISRGARADVYALNEAVVLKLFRPGTDPAEAAAEAALTGAVRGLTARLRPGLLVPECLGTTSVDGRPGILYERIKGPVMSRQLLDRPWLAVRFGRKLAELHAALHAMPAPPMLPAQRTRLERAVRLSGYLEPQVREAALSTLSTLPDGEWLCHGDFHPWNIILGPEGPVVIDWCDATRGNPVADVARTVLLLRGAARYARRSPRPILEFISRVCLQAYLRRYRALRPLPAAELSAWLPVLAAARLHENVEAEKRWLVRLAAGLLRRPPLSLSKERR